MLINRERLQIRIKEERYTKKLLAEKLGLSRQWLDKKLDGVEFTESEIIVLKRLFGNSIFFNLK